jgi:hypothetical protein
MVLKLKHHFSGCKEKKLISFLNCFEPEAFIFVACRPNVDFLPCFTFWLEQPSQWKELAPWGVSHLAGRPGSTLLLHLKKEGGDEQHHQDRIKNHSVQVAYHTGKSCWLGKI